MHDADAALFGAYRFGGSPAAVVIGPDGRVAGTPVLGAPEVIGAPRRRRMPGRSSVVRSYG